MPTHKSAKKRVKTNLKRQGRNRAAKSALKSKLKTLSEMKPDQRDDQVRRTQSVLDQAAAHGLIHKNKAARLKSRASRKPKAAR